jgi:hypothetical protein
MLSRFRPDLTPQERAWLTARAGCEGKAAEALFEACRALAGATPAAPPSKPRRPRDGFLAACGVDLDEIVHPLLIRLCAVFLDQGQAYWPMPGRELGLLIAVRRLLASGGVYPEFLVGLDREFRGQEEEGTSATQAVEEALAVFGVDGENLEAVLQAELLALPGWAGMIRQLEEQPRLAPHERVPASLMDYVAVRLTITKVAAANLSRRFRLGPVDAAWVRGEASHDDGGSRDLAAAAAFMDIAQLLGLSAGELAALDGRSRERLRREIEAFDQIERRRLYHLAYELRHEKAVLSALVKHARLPRGRTPGRPAAQVFFCVDEREESTRRHLEEVDPEIETFGAVGFFGVAIDYTGIDDPRGASLCPVVVKPQHAVIERPDPRHKHLHDMRAARRKIWSQRARGRFLSSRTLLRGWLSTAVLGVLSVFPLIARVLAPLSYAKLRQRLNESFLPVPLTELVFMRDDDAGHEAAHGLQLGFSVAEKVDRVASVLAPAGLRGDFARIVVILGHGSTNLNNPLESAYNCGACGGRRGGPNARLFAAMANLPDVRAGLEAAGIRIPQDTWFAGGDHDSSTDAIVLFDLHLAPSTHQKDLARIQRSFDQARALNAHERSRRFEAAETWHTPDEALRHVEERSEHLAEPRPEYGHCTNAVCIIGRRSLTRGLFLDRRAFLNSYDAAADQGDAHLTATLAAVAPVCGGINLEYYFSCVDNERFGCGTKLPHNVTGLVGVMNGYASDLRTGLSSQMVEIHEPMRILFVVETTPDRLLRAARRNALMTEFLENRWIRMAVIDPDCGQAYVYRDGGFERFDEEEGDLPVVTRSVDWYRGKMDHLPIARIEPKHVVERSTRR